MHRSALFLLAILVLVASPVEAQDSLVVRSTVASSDAEPGAVRVGEPVPSFEVTALRDSTTVYSSESLKGKVYLIDFWAVWCGPCIAEMPNLHEMYDKYKDNGFTILSLSFDGSPESVEGFRNKRWKMPWLHSYVEGRFDSALAEKFEVTGIPKPILVDSEGTIVAIEDDLRGGKLEETLKRVLAVENRAD